MNSTVGAAARIAAGMAFARDWPDSLARYAKAATRKYNSTSTRVGLGTLGKLFEGEAKKTPIRDLVRSTISSALGEAQVPAKVYPGAIIESTCREGMFNAAEAVKFLRIDAKSLRRLEGQSKTFVARHDVKGGAALYDKDRILHLGEVLRTSLRSPDCARLLGIPRYCLDAFVDAGLVQAVTDVDAVIVTGGALYSRASIVALCKKLRKRSCRVIGGVTLEKAMCRHAHPQEWLAVFNEMLAGDLPFMFATDGALSVSHALMVDGSSIASPDSGRFSVRDIRGVHVACQTAARILGTTPQFVSAAVQGGFMDGKLGKRNSALPLTGVLKFQQQFVLTEELCNLVGGESRGIAVRLRNAGYAPAAVINRTRVWRRREIEKYMKQRRQASL